MAEKQQRGVLRGGDFGALDDPRSRPGPAEAHAHGDAVMGGARAGRQPRCHAWDINCVRSSHLAGTAAWGCIAGARGDLVPVVADRERQLRVASTEAVDAAPTLRL